MNTTSKPQTENPTFFRFIVLLIFTMLIPASSCRENTVELQNFIEVRTFAGSDQTIGEPFGIAVQDEFIYVSDGEKGQILKIDKTGKSSIFAKDLDTPSQIVFDNEGNLLVADSGTHTIKKISKDGKIETIAGVENKKGFADGNANQSLFNAPIGIAVFENKIFVAE